VVFTVISASGVIDEHVFGKRLLKSNSRRDLNCSLSTGAVHPYVRLSLDGCVVKTGDGKVKGVEKTAVWQLENVVHL